jgi:hypothetical protein
MAGLFDTSDPSGMGLMGMLANPQTAGLLGMAGGLLSAAGPSRLPISNGQALGAGFQSMQQGFDNSLGMQRQLLQMQAMKGLMGGQQPQQSAQPDPTMAQGTPVSGGANVGGMSGLSAGMGSMAPQMPQQQAPAASSGSIYGKTPQQLFQQGMLMNMAGIQGGGDMMRIAVEHDPTLAMQMPTDSMKTAAAAYGYGSPDYTSALQNEVRKNGALSIRPGGGVMVGDRFITMPGAAPAGYMNQQDATGNWSVAPIPGGPQAVTGSESAKELGRAQNQNQPVWDPTANNGNGGFVLQTRANVNAAANGDQSVPVGIRNNNFGNIKGTNGQFATYDTPQAGINAADQTLAAYGSKHGINTLTGIANRWSPTGDGNNNPTQKAAAMSAASGVGVNQPINLADPATRARILPALFDTETPGWRNAMGGAQGAPAGGPMAAQPPLGQINAANASQVAPSKQMADTYGTLTSADANYQASRSALQSMLDITNKNAPGDTIARLLPQEWATRLSNDAAEYDKAHALYTSLQGKALGGGGTDASRANLEAAVPDFTKPQQARLQGLNAQLQQLDMNHLKTQFLAPIYQQSNEKQFTAQNAAFDKSITPAMMPQLQSLLSMPPGPDRGNALSAAMQDPAMKNALDLLSGMFK